MLGRALTEQQLADFLSVLSATGNVTKAAQAVNIGRSTAYALRKDDKAFADAWDEALETACDTLEEEARRRALEGCEEVVVSAGRVVMHNDQVLTVRRYSDTLTIALLRAHRPDKFRERSSVELTGKDGGPIKVENARERIAGRLARLAAPGAAQGDPGGPDGS